MQAFNIIIFTIIIAVSIDVGIVNIFGSHMFNILWQPDSSGQNLESNEV